MTDALTFLAALMTIIGAGLSICAWRDGTRISRLLARETHPTSYANRPLEESDQ